MKKLTSLIVILFCTLSYSQNKEVDKRNGFKTIKLGSDYSQFKGFKETNTKNRDYIIGFWGTSDENLGYLFDNKISLFELHFDKKTKKLVVIKAIIIIQKAYSNPVISERYGNIKNKLELSLGNANYVKSFVDEAIDKTIQNGYLLNQDLIKTFWYGTNVDMSFDLVVNNAKFNEDMVIKPKECITSFVLTIYSVRNIKNNINNGF